MNWSSVQFQCKTTNNLLGLESVLVQSNICDKCGTIWQPHTLNRRIKVPLSFLLGGSPELSFLVSPPNLIEPHCFALLILLIRRYVLVTCSNEFFSCFDSCIGSVLFGSCLQIGSIWQCDIYLGSLPWANQLGNLIQMRLFIGSFVFVILSLDLMFFCIVLCWSFALWAITRASFTLLVTWYTYKTLPKNKKRQPGDMIPQATRREPQKKVTKSKERQADAHKKNNQSLKNYLCTNWRAS